MEKIKGTALIGRLKFAEKEIDADKMKGMLGMLSPDFQEAISSHLLSSQLYPFDYYIQLNRALGKVVGGGELKSIIDSTCASAHIILSTTYKSWVRSRVVDTIKRIPDYWRTYYEGSGKLVIRNLSEGSVVIGATGFEQSHVEHNYGIQGFCKALVECSGGENVRTNTIVAEPHENWAFTITWE